MSSISKTSIESSNRQSFFKLRSPSPCHRKSDDLYEEVSDLSFERMEKLCDMLDRDDIKENLPKFKTTQEEVGYILSMEKFAKEIERSRSKSLCEGFSELSIDSRKSLQTRQNIQVDAKLMPKMEDTLDEVNLMLVMGKLLVDEEKLHFSTPKSSSFKNISQSANVIKYESKLLPQTRNITFRKGQFLHPFSASPQKYGFVQSHSMSPNCGPQAMKENAMASYRYRN